MGLKTSDDINTLRILKENSIKNFNLVFGLNADSRYDKKQFDFSHEPHHHNLHSTIYFRNHKGIYGDSNVSSVFNVKLAPYLAKAIDEEKINLFKRAMELIDIDIKDMIYNLEEEKNKLELLINEIKDPTWGSDIIIDEF